MTPSRWSETPRVQTKDDAHPVLKATLTCLRDALVQEKYGACVELMVLARVFGATDQQIDSSLMGQSAAWLN